MTNEEKIALLQGRVKKTEAKGNFTTGVVRKLNRQIRNLSK